LSAFADSSFLVSLYLRDANSNLATARMSEIASPLMLSSLGELELTNALQLYVFRKQMDESNLRGALAALRADIESRTLVVQPIHDAMYVEAHRLSMHWSAKLGTRSLDILQVAAAIVLEADSFHTFDDRQKKLAKVAGLKCR
jgi:predicted nucleic acid-binding protein